MMLSIVIPVLNEEQNVPELVRRLRHVLGPAGISFEVVFVDDGSTRRTPEILDAPARARTRGSRRCTSSRNFGHQARDLGRAATRRAATRW